MLPEDAWKGLLQANGRWKKIYSNWVLPTKFQFQVRQQLVYNSNWLLLRKFALLSQLNCISVGSFSYFSDCNFRNWTAVLLLISFIKYRSFDVHATDICWSLERNKIYLLNSSLSLLYTVAGFVVSFEVQHFELNANICKMRCVTYIGFTEVILEVKWTYQPRPQGLLGIFTFVFKMYRPVKYYF